MKRKNGSSAVFLTVILAALFSITLTFIYAAHEMNIESRSDATFNLAGQSLMSEYNNEIFKEYNLLLIKGSDRELSNKFSNYAGCTLDRDRLARFKDCTVTNGPFSVLNTSQIKRQIITSYKYWMVRDLLSGPTSQNNETALHSLNHGPTIDSLPSRYLPARSLVNDVEKFAGNISNPSAIFNESTARYKLDSYILIHFNNDRKVEHESHFFTREVEYILGGKLSDEDNIKSVNRGLMVIFTASNLKHIYLSPEKSGLVEAASQAATPGALGLVTQAAISAAWAGAEALNDVKLLHKGLKVPLDKDDLSWATDLDGVLAGIEEDCIKPKINRGLDYEEYLRMLLFMRNEEVKLNRILDLIQINMRKNYDSDFLISEYGTGVSIEATVNRYKMKYDCAY